MRTIIIIAAVFLFQTTIIQPNYGGRGGVMYHQGGGTTIWGNGSHNGTYQYWGSDGRTGIGQFPYYGHLMSFLR